MALDLIKQQEMTKAAEHRKQEAEYAAYVKQMEVRHHLVPALFSVAWCWLYLSCLWPAHPTAAVGKTRKCEYRCKTKRANPHEEECFLE